MTTPLAVGLAYLAFRRDARRDRGEQARAVSIGLERRAEGGAKVDVANNSPLQLNGHEGRGGRRGQHLTTIAQVDKLAPGQTVSGAFPIDDQLRDGPPGDVVAEVSFFDAAGRRWLLKWTGELIPVGQRWWQGDRDPWSTKCWQRQSRPLR